ncbi:MAG: hypothetical protein J5666_00910 [Bacilli bacterium]|nr:hypothetical protein [Bacilli bacterium]
MKKILGFLIIISIFLISGCAIELSMEKQDNKEEIKSVKLMSEAGIPLTYQEQSKSVSMLSRNLFYSFSDYESIVRFADIRGFSLISSYDEAYFEDNGLILFTITEAYIGTVHTMNMHLVGSTIETNYQKISNGPGSAASEAWYVYIEMAKTDLSLVKQINCRGTLYPFDGDSLLPAEMANNYSLLFTYNDACYSLSPGFLVVDNVTVSNELSLEDMQSIYQLLRANRIDKYEGSWHFVKPGESYNAFYLSYNLYSTIEVWYSEDAICQEPEFQLLMNVIETIYNQYIAQYLEVE